MAHARPELPGCAMQNRMTPIGRSIVQGRENEWPLM
jgi:hypothetical protein